MSGFGGLREKLERTGTDIEEIVHPIFLVGIVVIVVTDDSAIQAGRAGAPLRHLGVGISWLEFDGVRG
jgi:hypothetical protein